MISLPQVVDLTFSDRHQGSMFFFFGGGGGVEFRKLNFLGAGQSQGRRGNCPTNNSHKCCKIFQFLKEFFFTAKCS